MSSKHIFISTKHNDLFPRAMIALLIVPQFRMHSSIVALFEAHKLNKWLSEERAEKFKIGKRALMKLCYSTSWETGS